MLDDLASRYLDGETSEAEELELLDLLKGDEAARRDFARLVNQHGALRWQFSEPKPVTARRRRRFPAPQRNSRFVSLLAAGAAAALFLVVVAGVSRPKPAPQKPAEIVRTEEPPPSPPRPAPPPPAPRNETDPPFRDALPHAPEPPRPTPEPPKPLPPPPPPVVAEAPKPPTVVAPNPIATLEEVGNATLDGRPAKAGDPLLPAQVVDGAARLRWPDGMSIQLDGRLALNTPLALTRGHAAVDVARPLAISTPHAEVRALGTRFTLRVEAESTRLEVQEGKVRITNGLATADVGPSHYAIAAPKTPLSAKPLPLEVFRISFGPNDGSLPPDFAADDGSPFDEKRGWGWTNDLRKATRNRQKGSALERRQIAAGSALHVERWEIAVPNGRYLLTLSCGDQFAQQQGPHRVVAEGQAVVRDVMTKAGQHVIVERVPIDVKDGRFTLDAGAVGTPRLDKDASADTILNYLILRRIR